MINTRFALNGTLLDYDEDIAETAMTMWREDPEYTDGDSPIDVAVYFPNGTTLPLSDFIGRTAGDDAEVEADRYDNLPILFATLGTV